MHVIIDRNNRVGKYGRLLGSILSNGLQVGDASVRAGFAKPFSQRDEGKIPDIERVFKEGKID